jgi:hypothetical protein
MPDPTAKRECMEQCLQEYRRCVEDNKDAAMECVERILIFCVRERMNVSLKRQLDAECKKIYDECLKGCPAG